jgi:hypothetical protein
MRRYFEHQLRPFPPTPLESRFFCRAMDKDPLPVAQLLHCVNLESHISPRRPRTQEFGQRTFGYRSRLDEVPVALTGISNR